MPLTRTGSQRHARGAEHGDREIRRERRRPVDVGQRRRRRGEPVAAADAGVVRVVDGAAAARRGDGDDDRSAIPRQRDVHVTDDAGVVAAGGGDAERLAVGAVIGRAVDVGDRRRVAGLSIQPAIDREGLAFQSRAHQRQPSRVGIDRVDRIEEAADEDRAAHLHRAVQPEVGAGRQLARLRMADAARDASQRRGGARDFDAASVGEDGVRDHRGLAADGAIDVRRVERVRDDAGGRARHQPRAFVDGEGRADARLHRRGAVGAAAQVRGAEAGRDGQPPRRRPGVGHEHGLAAQVRVAIGAQPDVDGIGPSGHVMEELAAGEGGALADLRALDVAADRERRGRPSPPCASRAHRRRSCGCGRPPPRGRAIR